MIDNNSSSRNRFINGLLLVVAIGLLASSIYSVYVAWRTGLAQSRVETASRLMAIRTSPRSTETPGINAWVSWSLLNSNTTGSEDEIQRLRGLVLPRKGNQVPAQFRELLNALRVGLPERFGKATIKTELRNGGAPSGELEFRRVDFVENQNHVFVLTSRKNENIQSDIGDFCDRTSTHLIEVNKKWSQQESQIALSLQRIRSARVARFYVLNEDESLISLPIDGSVRSEDTTESNQDSTFLSEGVEFKKNPLSPSFVSNHFFFNFEFALPLASQSNYSGIYLDLGGHGLVASITIPMIYNGKRSVLGADIAFDMDWEAFARHLSPSLVSHVVSTPNLDSRNWSPWSEFLQGVPDAKTELRSELRELAERESSDAGSSARKSVYLATTRRGSDMMAIQVNRQTWLLLMVAANEVQMPWTMMLLTGFVFVGLLLRTEQRRRQAVVAQRSALGEMEEKQNLLDTMQVPLMVVDPNTDQLVYCNRAAESIGMLEGNFFGRDIVAPDEESQEHYKKTQSLSEEQRRAYGVQIRHRHKEPGQSETSNKESIDYAIVRSVAVTAPIETLRANEHHRLGILFLVNEQRDLDLLLRQRLVETRTDERRQLSGLLNHGIDSLMRILENRISTKSGSATPQNEFDLWLANYLSQRIQLLAWTLENWGKTPSIADERIIERNTVNSTLEHYEKVFRIAAEDRELREQLHWNNGVISAATPGKELFAIQIDWTDESCFAVPRDGVFGFFISEVLINAVRHGKPGSKIQLNIEENLIRNELKFSVLNLTEGENTNTKPFGGMAIVIELARMSGWSQPEFSVENSRFVVSWSVPLIRRKTEGQGD